MDMLVFHPPKNPTKVRELNLLLVPALLAIVSELLCVVYRVHDHCRHGTKLYRPVPALLAIVSELVCGS